MVGLPAGPVWWMGNEWREWVSWAKLTPSDPCSEVLTYRRCGPFLPFTLTMSVASTGTGQEIHRGSQRQIGGSSLRWCNGKQTLWSQVSSGG